MDINSLSEKYQLSASEKNILIYINDHKEQKNLSIRHVAKQTYTSPSSIVALCQKIGFTGYSELIYYIVGAKNLTFSLQDRSDIIQQYGEPFKELMIKHQDSFILLLASGYSEHIANYMSDYLNLHGFRATTCSHLQMIRPENKDNTLVFSLSNSGETKRLVELISLAQKNNIDTISFIGNSESRLAKIANLAIPSDTNSHYSYQDYYPQLFFGTTLNNFELLMSFVLSNND